MLRNLSGWHFVILAILIILLFGAPKLPKLARSLGQSLRIFKTEIKHLQEETPEDDGSSVEGKVMPPGSDKKM